MNGRHPFTEEQAENVRNIIRQAGAELGQAQLKLGLGFNLIFCRFGFYRFGLVELVWWIKFCRFNGKHNRTARQLVRFVVASG